MISFSELQQNVSLFEGADVDTLISVGNYTLSMSSLSSNQDSEVLSRARSALGGYQNEEGEIEDTISAMVHFDRDLKLWTIVYCIDRLNQMDVSENQWVEKEGKKIPAKEALFELLGSLWSMATVNRLFLKYREINLRTTIEAEKNITFDVVDFEKEAARLSERLEEVRSFIKDTKEPDSTDLGRFLENDDDYDLDLESESSWEDEEETDEMGATPEVEATVTAPPVTPQTPVVETKRERKPSVFENTPIPPPSAALQQPTPKAPQPPPMSVSSPDSFQMGEEALQAEQIRQMERRKNRNVPHLQAAQVGQGMATHPDITPQEMAALQQQGHQLFQRENQTRVELSEQTIPDTNPNLNLQRLVEEREQRATRTKRGNNPRFQQSKVR
jgi:hypothetical protein